MDHLSLFWVDPDREKHLKAIETDFFQRIFRAVKEESLLLPPIPSVVIQLQKICNNPMTTSKDVSTCLLDDASLTAAVIRSANSAIFSPRINTACYDINVAVSRLGILRVLGITTAHAVQAMKKNSPFNLQCNALLYKSAKLSRRFASTMALVCKKLKYYDVTNSHLEVEKALLIGLLADIGIYSAVHAYKTYSDEGNYLDFDIATHVFWSVSKEASQFILKKWAFDVDFIEVSANRRIGPSSNDIRYLDIAKMANYLLMFRNNRENIEQHDIELTLAGAEVMYDLSNLTDAEFHRQLDDIINNCGF